MSNSPVAAVDAGCSKTGPKCCHDSSKFFRMNSNAFSELAARQMRIFPERACRNLRSLSRCSMGKHTGFIEHGRELPTRRPVAERVNDWFEIYQDFPEASLRNQGA